MDTSTCLIIIAALYCVLYFFDTFFKTCAHYPYIQLLKNTGLQIKILQVTWKTTAFNRMLLRWGSKYTKFFSGWFTVGMYVTLAFLPVALVVLLMTVYQCFFKTADVSSNLIMEPIIPGINFPSAELGYYSAVLIVCSIFHELGHAISAVKDDVHVTNVGINVLLILPIAFVSLSQENLQRQKPWNSLKVFCAGVWHNIVLSLFAYVLYLSLPILFASMFRVGEGVTVSYLTDQSPLLGPKGLFVGDTVTRINDCAVTDENTWTACLHQARVYKLGFCVTSDLVHALDETVALNLKPNGELDCCGPDRTASACFEYMDNNDGILEIPTHVCLPIRPVAERATELCGGAAKCHDLHCIRPSLPNNTNVFKVQCADKVVIYLGYAGDLMQTVEVSSYITKYFFASTYLPDTIEKVCKYFVLFSLGLALVNVIPCLAMDGHFISNALIFIVFGKRLSDQMLKFLYVLIPLCGTLLFVSLILHTLWTNLIV